jgi:hypothetical protein
MDLVEEAGLTAPSSARQRASRSSGTTTEANLALGPADAGIQAAKP